MSHVCNSVVGEMLGGVLHLGLLGMMSSESKSQAAGDRSSSGPMRGSAGVLNLLPFFPPLAASWSESYFPHCLGNCPEVTLCDLHRNPDPCS